MCLSKNYCKIEHKWCKYCKSKGCTFGFRKQEGYVDLNTLHTCPQRESLRTISLGEIIHKVDLDKVLSLLFEIYPKEEKNINGYKDLYSTLLTLKPSKSTYTLVCNKSQQWGYDAYGVQNGKSSKYGDVLGFVNWSEWLYMNISKETLSNLSTEDIVAACFYEMTYYGFTEEKIQASYNNLINNFEE